MPIKEFLPKISIITVCYNAENVLEGTIKSIVAQTYKNIEYIIIDGKSTDYTLSIIKKYETNISKWISEPDRGLYDAMNKGLKLATGDFVWFMNAGDHIFAPDSLEKAVRQVTPEIDVFYGEIMLVDKNRTHLGTRSEKTTQKLPEKLTWKSLRLGMVVSHQGVIARRSIAPKYDITNLSADIDWVINCLKRSKQTYHTHLILAEYLIGGISVQKHRKSLTDRYKILQKHYGILPNFLNHILIALRALKH